MKRSYYIVRVLLVWLAASFSFTVGDDSSSSSFTEIVEKREHRSSAVATTTTTSARHYWNTHRQLNGNYLSTKCEMDTDHVQDALLRAGWIPYIAPHVTDDCELTSSTSVFCTVGMTEFGVNRTVTICQAIQGLPITVDLTSMACHDIISGMRASIRYSILKYVACVAPSCNSNEQDLMARYLVARDIAEYIEQQGTLDTCTVDGLADDFDLLPSAAVSVYASPSYCWFWCSVLVLLSTGAVVSAW